MPTHHPPCLRLISLLHLQIPKRLQRRTFSLKTASHNLLGLKLETPGIVNTLIQVFPETFPITLLSSLKRELGSSGLGKISDMVNRGP